MRHLNPIAPVKIIFAIVVFFLACFLFFQGSFYGLIILGASLSLALREGIEIDVFNKRYRKLNSVFAVTFGFWKPLPELEYVSIFKTTVKTRARVITAQAISSQVVYQINLFYNRNKHITAYQGESKEDAIVVAQNLATALELEIYDATREE